MFDSGIRILVVDDMMTMRKIVMKALKEIGFSALVEAADGALAWEALNQSAEPFSLIVSDWNMPNSTGIDLLKRVRSSRFKDLPFVLLTAESEKSQITEALQAGVSGYIVKPFDVATLRTQLEGLSKKKNAA